MTAVAPDRLTEQQGSRARGRRAVDADLARARTALDEAADAPTAAERYLAAHAAALRVAAVVLAVRARPAPGGRPRNAWRLLAEVAPELAEWAAFYAATQQRRDALRTGSVGVVGAREADDLLRDTEGFLALVQQAVAPPGPAARRPAPGTS
ncbi:hypothetical protein GCM10009616_39660 [Microlunatus lacustris]